MSFFECTPSGNLLNRFAKEIDAIDCMVPEGLKMMLSYAFKLLEVCIIVLMATPFAAVIILPLAFLYACVQVYNPLFSAPIFIFESRAVDSSVTVLAGSKTNSAVSICEGVCGLRKSLCNPCRFHSLKLAFCFSNWGGFCRASTWPRPVSCGDSKPSAARLSTPTSTRRCRAPASFGRSESSPGSSCKPTKESTLTRPPTSPDLWPPGEMINGSDYGGL